MSITWNTGPAAMRARHNLRLNKKKKKKKRAPSPKLQAPSGNVNWFKKKFERDLKKNTIKKDNKI